MNRVLFVICLSSMALAASAAEVDFSRHILDLDGKDIPMSAAKDAPPLDLATVAGMALLAEPPADPRAPAPDTGDKLRRFDLALRTHGGHVVSLSAEDIALLKAAVSKSYGPLVVGRAFELLDPVKK